MKCLVCGNELDENDRNCYSCGAINVSHPQNQLIKDYISKETNNNVTIEEIINDRIDPMMEKQKIQRQEEKKAKIFFGINFAFYGVILLVAIIGMIILPIINKNSELSISINPIFSIGIIGGIIFSLFYDLCHKILLKKANLPWYGSFIFLIIILAYFLITIIVFLMFGLNEKTLEINKVINIIFYIITGITSFYNIFVESRLVYGNGFRLFVIGIYITLIEVAIKFLPLNRSLELIISILIICTIIYIYINFAFSFANRFNFNKWIFLFFPGIAIPIMAFNKNYQYINY